MARNKRFTVKEFGTFKTEFTRWQKRFGLDGYVVFFSHEPLDDCFADISVNQKEMAAKVRLNSALKEADYVDADVLGTAKHEAIHLLCERVTTYGYTRFVTKDQMYEAEEELVRRLEGLIPDA